MRAALKEGAFAALLAGPGELADVVGKDAAALSATGLKQLEDIHRALHATLSSVGAAGAADLAAAAFLKHQVRRNLPPSRTGGL